jgi:hypothetical protein
MAHTDASGAQRRLRRIKQQAATAHEVETV